MNRHILPFQGWRLIFFRVFVVCCLAVLIIRMGDLQLGHAKQFQQDAEENRRLVELIPAPRGRIYDRNKVALAKNDPAYNVAIVPAELPDDPADILDVYNRLSALIDVPATRAIADAVGRTTERSIDEMVREGKGIAPYRQVIVAKDIPFEVAAQIMEESQLLPGVSIKVASVRQYPTGALTAHIVGYLAPIGPEEEERLRALGYDPAYDRYGIAGIEGFFEEQLAGKRGQQIWSSDVAGRKLELLDETNPVAGTSIQLTIDVDLQAAAQEALSREINIVNADAHRVVTQQGVVIAMNPNNGQILAMVSWPSYDNTRFARAIDGDYYMKEFNDPLRPLVNHAISALYPPGSTWKLLTSVGVVEEHVISPTDQLFDPGKLILYNAYAPRDAGRAQTFVCWDRNGHKEVNLRKAIAQSCDVYFYQVGGGNKEVSTSILRPGGLGIYDLYRWATALGIGSELGVELPGELAGRMPDPQWKRRNYGQSWSTGDTYNAAFGQGYVTVTPLQLVTAVSAIVNGGTLYQPSVVMNLQDATGNIVQDFTPKVDRTVVPQQGQDIVLTLQEDMLINGQTSLACRCEEDSDYYDASSCNPQTYTSQFDMDKNDTDDVHNWVSYKVNVPFNYTFNGGVCDIQSFESMDRESKKEQDGRPAVGHYIPPFATDNTLGLIRDGMLAAVNEGTASKAKLDYVQVAGKTGTAEYCDDIAWSLDMCKPGEWPSHAWFVGYAPYENPEIIVVAFVYNGHEGSGVSAPIVRDVLDAYFRIKAERAHTTVGQQNIPPAQPTAAPAQ